MQNSCTDTSSNNGYGSSSSASILSQSADNGSSGVSSPQCQSIEAAPPVNGSTNNNVSVQSLLQEKKQLNELLNAAMTKLHAKFGGSEDPDVQNTIHTKLNELRKTVGTIEDAARRQHTEIDTKMDDVQNTLKQKLLTKRTELHQQKEQLTVRLLSAYLQGGGNEAA